MWPRQNGQADNTRNAQGKHFGLWWPKQGLGGHRRPTSFYQPWLRCRRASSGRNSHPPAREETVRSDPLRATRAKQRGVTTHIKAADPRGGVAGPDHLRQRPHLLHLGGYPVGVWETLLQKEGSVAMGLSLAAPSLRAPERPRWAKGPPS